LEDIVSKSQATIPVVEEKAVITTRTVPKGRVKVETKTDVTEELIKAELETSAVDITRVPIDRIIDQTPEIIPRVMSPSSRWSKRS